MRPHMDDTRVIRLWVVEDNPAYAYLVRKAFSYRQNVTRWELTIAVALTPSEKI
jgi:hypothetical protein